MKHNIIFMKKDIFRISTFVLLVLSLVSGGSIIFSREYLGGDFRMDNVYAMFSTVSEWLLFFSAACLFGREFQYKTINMIRISNRSCAQILTRKLIVMVTLSAIIAFVSYIEIVLYSFIYGYDIDVLSLFAHLVIAYCVYGTFIFALTTPFVMLFKNIIYPFITLLIVVSMFPYVTNILSSLGMSDAGISLIPFSFMRHAFSFATFSIFQVVVMGLWSVGLLMLSYVMYRKRGFI